MRILLLVAMLVACAGCAVGRGDYVVRESNYLTFRHAFTEAAAERARKNAEKHCAEVKLIALRTRSTCTMTECSTDYQCMDREEAARVAAPDVRKP